MSVEVQHIPTSETIGYWPTLGKFVNKAARRYQDDYDIEHMQEAIFSGKAALFGVWNNKTPVAAIVVGEKVYPKRRKMLIELAGGEGLKECGDAVLDQLVEYARIAGYAAVEVQGRFGWSKLLKKSMFRQAYAAYELEL